MCHVCPHGRRNAKGGVVACTLGGRIMESCPSGRHADANGIVRWRGIRWRGVPWPLRWKLTATQNKRLPGCGCAHRLKSWWEALRTRASEP